MPARICCSNTGCCSWRAFLSGLCSMNSVGIHEERAPQSWVEKSVRGGWLSPCSHSRKKSTNHRSVSTKCSLYLIFPPSLIACLATAGEICLWHLLTRNKCIISQVFKDCPLLPEDLGSYVWRNRGPWAEASSASSTLSWHSHPG